MLNLGWVKNTRLPLNKRIIGPLKQSLPLKYQPPYAWRLEAGDLMAYFSARQVKGNIHKFTHTNKFEQLGLWDQFLLARFRTFLDKMSKSRGEHGSLLDNTIVLHGCATSTLHWCEHYPTIIAGGKNLGYKHGHYHEFPSSVPFSNLFVSMLTNAEVPAAKYQDSLGRIEKISGSHQATDCLRPLHHLVWWVLGPQFRFLH